MISTRDDNVRLTHALEQNGVADRTVVILTGDNGGLLPSTNTKLGLGGKGIAVRGRYACASDRAVARSLRLRARHATSR